MAVVTLKALHNCLKLLENPSELKRRLPASSNPRTLKEGLYETSRLVGVDEGVFKEAQTIAALIGAQRFVMIGGEPSVTDHVARVFDNSRLLLTGLVSAVSFENATVGHMGAGPQAGGCNGRSFTWLGSTQERTACGSGTAQRRRGNPTRQPETPAFGKHAVDLQAFQGASSSTCWVSRHNPAASREVFRW